MQDSNFVLAPAAGLSLALFDADTGEEAGLVTRLRTPGINHLALSQDGCRMAVAGEDFGIKLLIFSDATSWEKEEANLEGKNPYRDLL